MWKECDNLHSKSFPRRATHARLLFFFPPGQISPCHLTRCSEHLATDRTVTQRGHLSKKKYRVKSRGQIVSGIMFRLQQTFPENSKGPGHGPQDWFWYGSLTHDPAEFVEFSPKPPAVNDHLHTRTWFPLWKRGGRTGLTLHSLPSGPQRGWGFVFLAKGGELGHVL